MVKDYYIPFAKTSVSKSDVLTVTDAVKNGWGRNCNYYIDSFEKTFCKYINRKYSILTSSCTGAIHLALRSIGIKEGDEIIVPEITWIGTIAPILYEKAKPIFVDVNEKDWFIDTDKLIKKITKKTKAIIVVHLYGNMGNINSLKKICKKKKILLIEDAAEALGSKLGTKMAGSIGDIGVFSFHGTKTLSTGEGGALVTNNKQIYKKALIQSNHGRNRNKHNNFWMDEIGLKYKMSNLQAALGYSQLKRVRKIINKKRKIFNFYKKYLGKYGNMNLEKKGLVNSYWLPSIVFEKKYINKYKRDKLLAKANKIGIGLRPFFYPITIFPMFHKSSNTVAYDIFWRGINLPSFESITLADMKIVVNFIKKELCLND
jgi:perosamine synthetase